MFGSPAFGWRARAAQNLLRLMRTARRAKRPQDAKYSGGLAKIASMRPKSGFLRMGATIGLMFWIAFPGQVHAGEAPLGFNFCAAPRPPSCIQAIKRTGRGLSACEQDVERYIASVFKYRVCLNAEMERAVREANLTIRDMRCLRDSKFCADEETEQQLDAPGLQKNAPAAKKTAKAAKGGGNVGKAAKAIKAMKGGAHNAPPASGRENNAANPQAR